MRGVRLEVRHLRERMDAGVGPAGAVDDSFFLRDLACGFVERALHGGQPRLHLPAVECGAVVSDGEFDIAHAALGNYRTQYRRQRNHR